MADPRAWEIDLVRGLCILGMVVVHFFYDLASFYAFDINMSSLPVVLLSRTGEFLFILMCGISCGFSRNNPRRGARLLLIAMGVSLVTWITVPHSNIFFGILHLLGVMVMLYPLLQRLAVPRLLIAAILILLAGPVVRAITMPNNLLAPIGLIGQDFSSYDFFPIIPWSDPFLIGVALSKTVYRQPRTVMPFVVPDNIVSLAGRYSLLIYLIHQPLILGILYLFLGSWPSA